MTKRKPPEEHKKNGRPSAFDTSLVENAFKLCLLGATDEQIADFFAVSVATINNWKERHPEFLEALKAGKAQADATVAESLYRRALGYSHEAVKIFMPAGATEPVYAPYTERYPPDTTAMIFWLKNRQKEQWRDKHEIESRNTTTVQHTVDFSGLSTDDLAAALELAEKAAPEPSQPKPH